MTFRVPGVEFPGEHFMPLPAGRGLGVEENFSFLLP